MGKFLESEKLAQTLFKHRSATISEAACCEGVYKGKRRSFCLPLEHAEENLIPSIRDTAPAYFSHRHIKWHDGRNGKPSNHLCDSMVCCVNFWLPFAYNPYPLANVLRRYYPVKLMLPIEDGQLVACEWIGAENYLGEKIRAKGERTRGANFTSADAEVMFERSDGKRQIVLIEWKYTESYSTTALKFSKHGSDRTQIYRHLWECADCPIDRERLPDYEDLFYEPFYQFMRQQFLAAEMEKAHELGADVVSVLHIAPAHNTDFKKITSPALQGLGDSATAVWTELVGARERFLSLSTEALFGGLTGDDVPGMEDWLAYVRERYGWLAEG